MRWQASVCNAHPGCCWFVLPRHFHVSRRLTTPTPTPPTRPTYPIRPSPSRRATHLRSYCTLFLGSCRDQRFAKPEAPYETDLGCGVHEGWNEGRNWTSNNLGDECIFGADCGMGRDFLRERGVAVRAGGRGQGGPSAKRRTDREVFGFYVPRRCFYVYCSCMRRRNETCSQRLRAAKLCRSGHVIGRRGV